jgi:hypothetical protein
MLKIRTLSNCSTRWIQQARLLCRRSIPTHTMQPLPLSHFNRFHRLNRLTVAERLPVLHRSVLYSEPCNFLARMAADRRCLSRRFRFRANYHRRPDKQPDKQPGNFRDSRKAVAGVVSLRRSLALTPAGQVTAATICTGRRVRLAWRGELVLVLTMVTITRSQAADEAYYAAGEARREADAASAKAASGVGNAQSNASAARSYAEAAQASADTARANADRAYK